jgi:hypothetical protein
MAASLVRLVRDRDPFLQRELASTLSCFLRLWIFRQLSKRQRVGCDHVPQSIDKQVFALTSIEAEAHLITVGCEMLRADAVPRSHNPALEQTECALNRVGVNLAVHVHTAAMVDRLMLGDRHRKVYGRFVACVIVRDEYLYIFTDVLPDVSGECARGNILSVKQSQVTAALTDTDHDLFGLSQAPVLAVRVTTDPCLVHLNLSVQHRRISDLHRSAYAMAQIPRRFVAHAQHALDLVRTHALARLTEQIHSRKPLNQRQVRIMEDSARHYRKLIITVFAVEQIFGSLKRYGFSIAARTLRAIRPAQSLEQFAAFSIG